MATLAAIMDALAAQVNIAIGEGGTATPAIENLQVESRMVFNPSPPCIDIYPADPSQEGIGFGKSSNSVTLTVRARVTTADHEAGQDLLLSMMDPAATTSLSKAIVDDRTLGNTVGNLVVTGPSGFGVFPVPAGMTGESLLGCTWQVLIYR